MGAAWKPESEDWYREALGSRYSQQKSASMRAVRKALGAGGDPLPEETQLASDIYKAQEVGNAQVSPMDEAVRRARLMERRMQMGLQGRLSTFLTGTRGQGPAQGPRGPSSLGQQTALGASSLWGTQ